LRQVSAADVSRSIAPEPDEPASASPEPPAAAGQS
jgi:hypothetical protein